MRPLRVLSPICAAPAPDYRRCDARAARHRRREGGHRQPDPPRSAPAEWQNAWRSELTSLGRSRQADTGASAVAADSNSGGNPTAAAMTRALAERICAPAGGATRRSHRRKPDSNFARPRAPPKTPARPPRRNRTAIVSATPAADPAEHHRVQPGSLARALPPRTSSSVAALLDRLIRPTGRG